MDSKIIFQKKRIYYLDPTRLKPSYIASKESGKYIFTDQSWGNGVITGEDDINSDGSVFYNRVSGIDLHGYISLTLGEISHLKTNEDAKLEKKELYDKQKIIHSIEINVEKNTVYDDSISFTIGVVDKKIANIFFIIHNRYAALLQKRITLKEEDQIVSGFFNNNSVVLENLNYKLTREKDLILLQNIEIDKSNCLYKKTNPLITQYYGLADKPYVEYNICVKYSYNYP